MKKNGNYVFKTSFVKMTTYFVLSLVFYMTLDYFHGKRGQHLHFPGRDDISTWQDFQVWFFNLCYIYDLPQLLYAYCIVTLKGNTDLIMELSKLDYLLVVSIFQKQKDQVKSESISLEQTHSILSEIKNDIDEL